MKFTEFIKDALSENNGGISSMRINTMYVVVLFTSVITYGFVYCIHQKPELVIAYLYAMCGLVAGCLGIKAYQKGKEEKVDSDAQTP